MGAQLRVYRQKIRSATTTKKITRAMELISASRIQKAQARMTAAIPYSRAVTRAVSAVATYSNIDHPLLTESENPTRAAMVIFTSDRGLAELLAPRFFVKPVICAPALRAKESRS